MKRGADRTIMDEKTNEQATRGADGAVKNEKTNKTDRFQRWQKIAIDQLTYALNLSLVLTVATLGYWFSLLRDEGFMPSAAAECFLWLSLLALAGSVLCGLACVVCRTWDFRGTARRAGRKCGAPTRGELRGLGHLTWGLFYVHLVGFALGAVLLAMTLFLTYAGRIT